MTASKKTKSRNFLSLAHSPTLGTILMVEETLRKARELIKIAELKRRLPRKVMHSTLVQVIDYLQESGKILVTAKGVVWIYAPASRLKALKANALEI